MRVEADDFAAAVAGLLGLYAIDQPGNWTPTFASFTDPRGARLVWTEQLARRSVSRRRPGDDEEPAGHAGSCASHGAGGRPHRDLPPTEHDRSATQLASRPL